MPSCQPYSEWDRSASSSTLEMAVNRLTSMSSATSARRSSGSTPFGWNGVTAFAAREINQIEELVEEFLPELMEGWNELFRG